MGFVVYEKDNGRAVVYYEKESAAKGRVTKHNKEYVIAVLKNEHGFYDGEYDYCNWNDFETVLKTTRVKGGINYHNL